MLRSVACHSYCFAAAPSRHSPVGERLGGAAFTFIVDVRNLFDGELGTAWFKAGLAVQKYMLTFLRDEKHQSQHILPGGPISFIDQRACTKNVVS